MKINLREVVIAILIFVVVFAVVQLSIGSYKVEMSSMYPTFYGGGVSTQWCGKNFQKTASWWTS